MHTTGILYLFINILMKKRKAKSANSPQDKRQIFVKSNSCM